MMRVQFQMYGKLSSVRLLLFLIASLLSAGICRAAAAEMPSLAPGKLLRQHPRLLFNDAQWPEIKARAAGSLKLHFEALQKQSAELPAQPETKDWGHEALT